MSRAQAWEELLDGTDRGLVLADDRLSVTLLPDRGGDVHAVRDLRTGVDVLWKTPWGLRIRASDDPPAGSAAEWVTRYAGGWQVLLPSGGGPSRHRGIDHPYHGEACSLPWAATVDEDGAGDRVRLQVRLSDAPFLVERAVSLAHGRCEVRLEERITNEGDHPVEYTWGHHPAFGPPLVAPGARLRHVRRRHPGGRGGERAGKPVRARERASVAGRSDARRPAARPVRRPRRIAAAVTRRLPLRLRRGRGDDRERGASTSPAPCPGSSTCFPTPGSGRSSAPPPVRPGSAEPSRRRSSRRRAFRPPGWAVSSRRPPRTAPSPPGQRWRPSCASACPPPARRR